MTFELTMANVITLFALFFTVLAALLKAIAWQAEKRSNEKFSALQASIDALAKVAREDAALVRQLETRIYQLQAELPRDYVRRDDFVQVLGQINTRIDNFALRVETAIFKSSQGGN